MDGLDALVIWWGQPLQIPLVFRLIDQSERSHRDIFFRGIFNWIARNYLVPFDFPYNLRNACFPRHLRSISSLFCKCTIFLPVMRVDRDFQLMVLLVSHRSLWVPCNYILIEEVSGCLVYTIGRHHGCLHF